jgi:hypothetical protein
MVSSYPKMWFPHMEVFWGYFWYKFRQRRRCICPPCSIPPQFHYISKIILRFSDTLHNIVLSFMMVIGLEKDITSSTKRATYS